MLRLLTAGESHGISLAGILEGLPGGLEVDKDFINLQLRRRQLGHGRGERMKIEQDRIEILSGIRHGKTLGSPVSFLIENKDWPSWKVPMSDEPVSPETDKRTIDRPRPGHADLAGALKYQTHDVRNILERASARETASRVAAGSFSRLLLRHFGIQIGSHVLAIGKVRIPEEIENTRAEEILNLDAESSIRCLDTDSTNKMIQEIDAARVSGDTVGGIVEIVATCVPQGLGSHIQWDRKLDGRIAQAMMSIPAAKGVEIGNAFSCSQEPGSRVHDEIFYNSQTKRFYHETNRAGGIEGGITNGEDLRIRLYMKPIPTLRKPLGSVNVHSKERFEAVFERSDTCVVPAAGVVAESMLGYVLADIFLEKFGGDSVEEIEGNYANYVRMLDEF